MKQTAVQWLVNNLPTDFQIDLIRRDILKIALEMEKEQIENAYKRGKRHKKPLKDSNPINKYKSE